ncbi:MAG: oxygen-dependent tRNA uridine(34) hydroxylase TrhO, partial [Luteibaculaceae bacterium]
LYLCINLNLLYSMQLYNIYSKEILQKKLAEEPFDRTTISFYRYVRIANPVEFRDRLYKIWDEIQVLGRIYVAHEGINAQLSVPKHNFEALKQSLEHFEELKNMPFKIAVEDDGKSFYKLAIKVREKVLADGLDDNAYDVTNVGRHLNAKEWNALMEKPETIVVDMRNHYESEVGHFENAILPDADTFREELPLVAEKLKGNEDKTILLYCTGGIRCEKTSAYLKHHGFEDVNQLHGGIIDYVRQIKAENLPSKFKGKNFVFDNRMGERITEDVIAQCHQCGAPCDTHVNCANDDCHLLFIQCDACKAKYNGCCSKNCVDFIALPLEEQKRLRKGKIKKNAHAVYKKGRVRPKVGELLASGDLQKLQD